MKKSTWWQMRCFAGSVLFGVAACLFSGMAAAQAPPPAPIVANDNRVPAGKLESGVLTLSLEIRAGAWHAEAEDGPPLYVQAFGERGKTAQIPGPLLRVPADTMVHV